MTNNKIVTFHILLALQFVLVAAGMLVNIKVGLFSMIIILSFTTICLIQLNNDEQTNWKAGQNIMTYMFTIWLCFYLLEILNPNNVLAAWNINLTPYALIPLICAFVVPLVVRTKKDIELLLIIWSVFVLVFTIKGYWQKNYGFSSKDLYFLHVLGGWRTHIIWSGIRYFSCFSDAANYGVHAAMSAVVFAISAFFVESKWLRIYFLCIAVGGLYGMGISGTRAAMGVIMGGMLMITVIAKNWKALLAGIFISISVFVFFSYTNIGSGNQYIHKMRSSFHPSEDASYQVRVENRQRMKELMAKKPLGYGIGLSKASNFDSREQMPYPPDSWLVSVWVETGIVGLILYLSIHSILFAWCSWILMFKVRNKGLRGLIAAWLCMDAGFFIATYVNDIMQYPNQLPVYIGFALCFAAPHIDKRMSEKSEEKEQHLRRPGMKIILRADVENLGRLGDVVTVKAGYGRNYLLPQGLAMLVTPGNLKAFELERKKLQARMDALRAAADDIAGKLEGLVLPIVMRVGDNDKLYGSVTTAIIGDALTAQGIEVDRRRILLDHPIRTLGDHPVRVRLHADVVASLTVKVVSEDKAHLVEEEAAEAPAEAPTEEAAE